MEKKLQDNLNSYLEYLTSERNRSPRTIKAYHDELILLFKMFSIIDLDFSIDKIRKSDITIKMDEIDVKLIRKMISKVRNELENSPLAISRKINCLRSFFKFLEKSEIIDKNPMKAISTPKLEVVVKTVMPIEEFSNVLNYYDLQFQTKIDKINNKILKSKDKMEWENILNQTILHRDELSLFIRLLYSSMARIIELRRIRIKDFDFNKDLLILFGKGNKQRQVPIDEKTIELINSIIQRKNLNKEDYLIVNKEGNNFNNNAGLEKRIRKIRKDIKTSEKLTPHAIRRYGASHSHDLGADLVALQDVLGHASPETTRKYVITNSAYLSKQNKEYHPLNREK